MDEMNLLAEDLRDTFSERGHSIGVALDADPAFRRSRRSKSSLARDLVLDTLERATLTRGVGWNQVRGGGLDMNLMVDGVGRRYRVRKATRDSYTGEYQILVPDDTILTVTGADPDSFFHVERWVFGYTITTDGMLDHVFEPG